MLLPIALLLFTLAVIQTLLLFFFSLNILSKLTRMRTKVPEVEARRQILNNAFF